MADTPQSNFQDDQNFELDIDKVFTDFMQEIEAVRSFVNITNPNNINNLYKALSPNNFSPTINVIKPETTVQESRCHAFFRLIGFPVASQDKKIFNPGLDIIKDPKRTIRLQDKINIAKAPLTGFEKLSIERETYTTRISQIFSIPTSIDAAALALSSGSIGARDNVSLRKFIASLEKGDEFDTSTIDASYTLELTGLVGSNEVQLKDYQDVSGKTPALASINFPRKHIIKPFLVDPRIDFTVSPADRLVAVPFVPDQASTKISSGVFVRRPLLEKVMRDRFSAETNIVDAGTATQNLINYIKNVPAIQDENIINQVNSDIFKTSEKSQFVQFLQIIQSMMIKLVDSLRIIHKAQSVYYWLPIPSKTGPEGGSEVRDVFIPTLISQDLVTPADTSILLQTLKSNIGRLYSQISSAAGIPDVGGFAFPNFKTTFGPDTSDAMGNKSQQSLDTLISRRKHVLQRANEALRTVEIIMGEFSGLGLCDIIAILGALYIMDKTKLTGFLDNDAFSRMQAIPELSSINHATITDAMSEFVSRVKDFYNIMDKIFQDVLIKHGLPT